ncbi:MAG: DUF362 domain-containing protein [Candidatus Omnitrophota bacterium]
MSKVAIVKCSTYDREALFEALSKSLSLIGGIDTLLAAHAKVLIKPNLLSARNPDEAVTTHPEFVRALIRVLKQKKCDISVGDSPSGFSGDFVERVYEVTGMKAVCAEEGAVLVKFDESKIINGIPIAKRVLESDVVISLPKFKTHGLVVMTGAIKNMYGAVPGLSKVEFHKKFPDPGEFSKLIVDVFSLARPHLSIVDGIWSMDGDGPAGGRVRHLGLIIAGFDAVSVDSVLCRIVGIKPDEIDMIAEAHRRNLGTSHSDDIEVLGENIKDVAVTDFRLASSSILKKIPPPLMKMLSRFIFLRPYINTVLCVTCRMCVKNCPMHTIIQKDNYLKIDYSTCINCLCCFEVCPHAAIEIRKSFLVKIFSLLQKK